MTCCQRSIKRVFDLVLSAVLVVCFYPFAAIVALCLWVFDSGPILFRQERIGLEGRKFLILKFRTMKADHGDSSPVTTKKDARITRIGRVLRRWKIDEIPQLWNVLKGDMSFVGPRPDVAGFADKLSGEDRIILSVRPGVTGPSTIAFRDEEELLSSQPSPERYNREVIWPEKVRLNRQYIRNYSFLEDLRIMLRTVRVL